MCQHPASRFYLVLVLRVFPHPNHDSCQCPQNSYQNQRAEGKQGGVVETGVGERTRGTCEMTRIPTLSGTDGRSKGMPKQRCCMVEMEMPR